MARVSVHLLWKPDSGHLERLRRLLHSEIDVTAGGAPRPGATFEILVHGFPSREDIEASARLRALVVPFAGIPKKTRELLLEFPRVSVHNLHYNAAPTAEMAVSLMLAAAKAIVPIDRTFRRHVWAPPGSIRSSILEGRTALILGYGQVGRRVAAACRGLGMEVLGIRRNPDGRGDGTRGPDALRELLPRAHVLHICLPQTPETEGLIGAEELGRLPPDAILVNVARGEIVHEEALFRALQDRGLAAAGLDVWYSYPKSEQRKSGAPHPPSAFPFHELDNVVMSPHRAGWSDETELQRADHLSELLNHAGCGEPMPNLVDLQRGY